jgi:hypothetical protein
LNNVIRFGENFIDMEFEPDWSKVKSLWDFLRSMIQLILYDSNKSDLISMAGIELVENAVKYAKNKNIKNKVVGFRLDSKLKDNIVIIKVTNSASSKDINLIKNTIEKLMKENNKRKIYLQKLVESANKDIDEETMELSIMRVVVEANADIIIEHLENDIIGIKATFNVEKKI